MLRIREVEVSWLVWPIKSWVAGIVIYPFIFYKGKPHLTRRRHEWIHIEQVRKEGWIKFYTKYLWYSITKGYHYIPYEIEAYRDQSLNNKNLWDSIPHTYSKGVFNLLLGKHERKTP